MTSQSPSQILDKETYEALTNSPTFAMSLGAKELFHTNFLGFLLESEHEDLIGIQVALRQALNFEVAQDEQARCFVWREKSHLDLILVPELLESASNGENASTTRALVVEAKLKSIPTRQQLTKYSEETLNSLTLEHELGWKRELCTKSDRKLSQIQPNLVLLAPSITEVPSGWKFVSWKTVHAALGEAVLKLDAHSSLKPLLQDYVNSLGYILGIVTQTHTYVETALEPANQITYGALEAEVRHELLRRLRLHDLAGKMAYDAWGRFLQNQLPNTVTESKDFSCEVIFTRSYPGLTIQVRAPNGLLIGVQIQAGDFRHFIKSQQTDKGLKDFAASSFLTKWFEAEVLSTQLEYKNNQNEVKEFKKFSQDKFLYTSIKISDKLLVDVQQAVIDSMIQAINLTLKTEQWTNRI